MRFVAVDWGSSRFRAYRVEDGQVAERITSSQGILSTASAELAATLVAELSPWRSFIERDRVPILMAGMVGSHRGLRDAGYQRLPIFLDALTTEQVEVSTPLDTRVTIRPGLAIADGEAYDVMRGEELQLLGAFRMRPASLFVFPGTHSKWVPIDDASTRPRIRTFSTMMTGELYAWLVEKSIVCRGLPESTRWDDTTFLRGVDQSQKDNDIIEEIFRTRARWLLGGVAPEAAPSYLSGLLIGHELGTTSRRHRPTADLVIVGAERLCALYQRAAQHLGLGSTVIGDEAATLEGFRSLHDAR
jgi:2-dehydro-3-deoxygalactonokinase